MNKKVQIAILLAAGLILPLLLSACARREPEPAGSLTIGSTSPVTGDWEGYWPNEAGDRDIAALISGCATVALSGNNALAYDDNVVKNIKESTDSEGNKTFTFTLHKDLRYSDGTTITAKDYVARILLFSSPVIVQAGCDGTLGANFMGWSAYHNGESREFAGVRLLGTHKFAVTVGKSYLPYYWDKAMVQITPLPRHAWLPEDIDVADDGKGAYFSGDFSYESCKAAIEQGRYASENRVSCGPYTLVSYDAGAKTATLTVNPYYKGNFENKKPRIARLVYRQIETDEQFDLLAAGEVDLLRKLSGEDATAALEIVKGGGFGAVGYHRSGYGKLTFACDFGPTRFAAVRQAIAHLIDRSALREAVCGPHGTVVHGPYGLDMRMYADAEKKLAENLNPYEKSLEAAVALLDADGWVLSLDGSPYTSGLRYKQVTEAEAAGFTHCITLSDGRILMPLILEWCSSADNAVTDALRVAFGQNPLVAAAGMEVRETCVTWQEMLNRLYRRADVDETYAAPRYNVFNLAGDFAPLYDPSYFYTLDENYIRLGYNPARIKDAQLDKLSMDLVYGVIPGDYHKFLSHWTDFVLLWNRLLPELPLYANIYYDVYTAKLKNYNTGDGLSLTDSLIGCYLEE